eukprot:TRINITY_DN2609_c1_g1_i1.p1 TRINITY_DN2609_c1_g1~~TRINITY_DN2609_c1_g1_i1.p1  ORF type:complete len:326 (+),score=71.65 TRINITY_DN2609_c1_g1_i1:71-1048(+)
MAAQAAVVHGIVVGKTAQVAGESQQQQQQLPAISRAARYEAEQQHMQQEHHQHAQAHSISGQPQDQRNLEILQMSCRDAHLPSSIRLGFVLKVYGILAFMLAITFSISLPFIFAKDATMEFFEKNTWVLIVVMAIVLAQFMFDMCMSCQMCCGSTGLLERYLRMMKTVPWNYIYLTVFSVCFGVMVGFVCAQYTAESVLLVFGISVLLVVALTVYAVRTKADFTGCGPYMVVVLLGFVMMLLVASFFPGSKLLTKFVGAAGAMVFGCIIVYDTQLIFGSASGSVGGGKRNFEYAIDMYAFAAWNLYLDFINFFIYMLELLGNRDA